MRDKLSQSIKVAMRTMAGDRWAALPSTHKEALEDIASAMSSLVAEDSFDVYVWDRIIKHASSSKMFVELKKLERQIPPSAAPP